MKQTAMQELKKYFEQQLKLHINNEIKYTTEEALVDAIQVCKNAINTKEKEQIIDACDIDKRSYDNAEQYYNETFNK